MVPVQDCRLVSTSTLIPLVRQRVLHLPHTEGADALVHSYLIEAAIIFCKESALIHMERHFDEVLEGQTVSFARASSINRQARQDVQEPQVTGSVLHRITAGGIILTPGMHYHAQSAESIRFLAKLNSVCIVGAIEPLPAATLIPFALVEDYAHELACGAAYLMQQLQAKAWTNHELAQLNRRKFYDGIRAAYRFRIEQTESARVHNPVRKRNFF
ncbi:hypothetical protein MM182_00065 [Aeromonas sp. MR19]|jgi:hypothetical protein|uniref:hypothetical protein n=1 Tax=Aeromonas sp. MR19 TaxID=2923421 RepID=UPI001F4A90CC|nr:hypothetical protein [Aeromonas sp. MR19]MCH7373789.1 hypothetical protein [Aeromonas sp. MR19]